MTKPAVRFKGFNDDWKECKFKNTVLIERGGSPRPIEKFITTDSYGLNWVKISDAPFLGNYITKTAEKIKPSGLSKTRQVEPGDLILSNSMSFGKPYIMAINGCIHDGWLLIKNTKNNFFLTFLCYLLGTESMLAQYRAAAAGSTVNNLNKELVGNTNSKFPSLNEQQKIGAFFTTLDKLITLSQRKYDKLVNIKKVMLTKMFPRDGAKVPELRFKGFTGDWEEHKLREISTIIDPHPSHRAPKEVKIGIPFIGIGDINEFGKINYSSVRIVDPSIYDEHCKRYDLNIPSIGIGRVASLGKVIRLRNDIGKYAVSPTISIIQFHNTIKLDYCFAYMTTPMFQNQFSSQSNGSTRLSVGIQDLRELNITLPTNKAEQQKIGEFSTTLDNLIALHQQKLEKLKDIKKACLEKMFV